MSKSAESALGKSSNDPIAEAIEGAKADSDLNYLRRQKEDAIRMKLDEFAKELAQAKQQRDQH